MPTDPRDAYPSSMRYKLIQLTFLMALLAGGLPSAAHAFDEDQCSQMVRGCLTRPTTARDECFEGASASPVCIGSNVGEVASKRSRFAPMIPGKEDEGPAFLGPQVVDRTCLENFDTQLGITLDLGQLSTAKRSSLSSQLDRCNQMAPTDLFRP